MQMLTAGGRDYGILILFFFPEKKNKKGLDGRVRNSYSLVSATTCQSTKARGADQRGNKFIHTAEAFEKA